MVDQSSASASEIVAGAIQDWDRGLIIGRRTFGKGLVQKTYFLPDQSAIRLTVSHYYTPAGALYRNLTTRAGMPTPVTCRPDMIQVSCFTKKTARGAFRTH